MDEFHQDPRVNEALVQLNTALGMYAEGSGQSYTFVLVPHQADEKVIGSVNGTPIDADNGVNPVGAFHLALQQRHQSKVGDPDTAFLARHPALPPREEG